jgi:hypothetical protein
VAADSVTIRLDGEVTIDRLSTALSGFSAILDELPRPHEAHVKWVVSALSHGSAVATAQAIPLDEGSATFVPTIVSDFIAAARTIASGDGDQRDEPILRLVRDLVQPATQESPIILETPEDDVVFGAPPSMVPSGDRLATTKSIATVRGRVETLSHRGGLRFTLYALAGDRPVSCYLRQDDEERMRDAWGRVADVTGIVTRDATSGRAIAIRQVTNVQVVNEGDPLGFLAARGVAPGGEPAEKVIRRIRDAS